MGSSARTELLAALMLAACGGAPGPAPVTPEVPPEVGAPAPMPVEETADPTVPPPAPSVPLSLVSPFASAVGVIEVARLAPLKVPTLSRWFVLELSGADLAKVEPACGFEPMEVIERVVFSGSVTGGHVLASFVSSLPAERLLDCLAKVYPEAEARDFGEHVALDLGTKRLWATERDGTVWMGERSDLEMAFGVGEPKMPQEPILLDGTPIPLPEGRAEEAIAGLTRDPRALLAGSVTGSAGAMFALPTLNVAFVGGDDELALVGQVDVRDENGRIHESELREKARRTFGRAFEEALPSVVATPLLAAVDDAVIDVTNEELRFSGRTTAVGLFRRLIEAQAQRELDRLLEK